MRLWEDIWDGRYDTMVSGEGGNWVGRYGTRTWMFAGQCRAWTDREGVTKEMGTREFVGESITEVGFGYSWFLCLSLKCLLVLLLLKSLVCFR